LGNLFVVVSAGNEGAPEDVAEFHKIQSEGTQLGPERWMLLALAFCMVV